MSDELDQVRRLIERSSLGTGGARELRTRTTREEAAQVVARAIGTKVPALTRRAGQVRKANMDADIPRFHPSRAQSASMAFYVAQGLERLERVVQSETKPADRTDAHTAGVTLAVRAEPSVDLHGGQPAPIPPALAGRNSEGDSAGGTANSLTDAEREALVSRARRGDSDAFGWLYDHYADLVYRYTLYWVSGDPMVAEDIVSETFLRAFRAIPAFRWQSRDIGAWFLTIARNLLIDWARSGLSRPEAPSWNVTADQLDIAAARHGPEESGLVAAPHHELWEAVRKLRPDQRECVVLRFLEGLSVRETALAMGRREGAIRALQFRAIRALVRSLPIPDVG
jgi:RNA polymerase sigma-70 factor (ECF subfamily)